MTLGIDEARDDVEAAGVMRCACWRQQRIVTNRDDTLPVNRNSGASRAGRRDDGSTSDY
jgi:hypothetical protein